MTDEQVYRKHADELVRFATGLVGPFDAADVVSDACLAAFHAPKWPSVRDKRAYLYRAVLNTARSHHRSTLARRLREQNAATGEAVEMQPADLDVLAAVDRLSIRQRAVVALTYWDGLTPSAIAEVLAVSEGAVKSHLARARSRLRRLLS